MSNRNTDSFETRYRSNDIAAAIVIVKKETNYCMDIEKDSYRMLNDQKFPISQFEIACSVISF